MQGKRNLKKPTNFLTLRTAKQFPLLKCEGSRGGKEELIWLLIFISFFFWPPHFACCLCLAWWWLFLLFLRFERPCSSATISQLLNCCVLVWFCYYLLKLLLITWPQAPSSLTRHLVVLSTHISLWLYKFITDFKIPKVKHEIQHTVLSKRWSILIRMFCTVNAYAYHCSWFTTVYSYCEMFYEISFIFV